MRMGLHLLLIFFFTGGTSLAQLNDSSQQETGLILDMEEVFEREEEQALRESLKEFERQTKSKLFIVSVGNTEDFSDFDQYALHILDRYDFREKIDNNGLVLIFSGGLRKIHLNTEMEARKIVEDSVYQRVINDLLIPSFKTRDYHQGIEKSLTELLRVYNL